MITYIKEKNSLTHSFFFKKIWGAISLVTKLKNFPSPHSPTTKKKKPKKYAYASFTSNSLLVFLYLGKLAYVVS